MLFHKVEFILYDNGHDKFERVSDDVQDILEKVYNDVDDIFEKDSYDDKDLLEKVFNDGDDLCLKAFLMMLKTYL